MWNFGLTKPHLDSFNAMSTGADLGSVIAVMSLSGGCEMSCVTHIKTSHFLFIEGTVVQLQGTLLHVKVVTLCSGLYSSTYTRGDQETLITAKQASSWLILH